MTGVRPGGQQNKRQEKGPKNWTAWEKNNLTRPQKLEKGSGVRIPLSGRRTTAVGVGGGGYKALSQCPGSEVNGRGEN